jgi:hypothetical protein
MFNSDSTFEIKFTSGNNNFGNKGKWNISDNKLNFNIEGDLISSDYSFSNNDKILTITDSPESTMDFVKQ